MARAIGLKGHEDSVRSAAFSPSGRHIITASADNTARVWGADGSGPVLTLRGHEGGARSAAFSPDGRRIVTLSDGDFTARVWPFDIPELQRLLREANADCLAPELRQSYLAEEEEQARERHEACERSYGRPPSRAAAP